MKFVTGATTALVLYLYYWTTQTAAAVDVIVEKESLVKAAALDGNHGDLLVSSNRLVVSGDNKEESNPNRSSFFVPNHSSGGNRDVPDTSAVASHDSGITDSVDSADAQSFQLRTSASMDTLQNQLVEARIKGDKSEIINATANAIRGSAAIMEEAKAKSETVVADLLFQEQHATQQQQHVTDTIGWKTHLITNSKSAMAQVEKAMEVFPKILSYLESTAEGNAEERKKEEDYQDQVDAPAAQPDNRDMLSGRRILLDAAAAAAADSPPRKRSSSSSSASSSPEDMVRFHKREVAKNHRKLYNQLEENQNHHAKNHFDRVQKLHKVLQNGDHAGVHRHLSKIHSRVSNATERSRNRRRRRLNADNDSKANQCKLLMGCVGQMTIYDMILYYYSDDIDDQAGDIDDNIYRHVEAPNVYEVYNNENVVKARNEYSNNHNADWYDSSSQRQWCDDTLQLFFRNVEYGAVPHWEGATVSAICLAQGSHTYVKLDQIATKVGFQAADEISKEMFECSRRLYNANPTRKSPFPFTSQKISIDPDASSIVETGGSSGGVTGRPGGAADSKYKVFDNNDSSYWRSREGAVGYPHKLTIRSDYRKKCVAWDDSDSDDYLKAWTCSDSNNRFKWFYDKESKQIKSRHETGKCMEAMSNKATIQVRSCSSTSRQKFYEVSYYGIKNEGRNRCMDKSSDNHIKTRDCHDEHNQDFMEVAQNDFFTKMIPPTVEFKIQFDGYPASAEIRSVEIKWKKGEECPRDKITMKTAFSGGDNIAFEWSDEVETSSMLIQTALPISTTTNRILIKCDNPLKRIAVYEIKVYGTLAADGNALPEFDGSYEEAFLVPTNVEMGSSARDDYGQVKGASVTLFKYEEGLVANGLEALQNTIVGTMGKVWDDWLKDGTDNLRMQLRTRYSNPHSEGHYDNADSYMRMLKESEEDEEIKKQMVIGYARKVGSYSSGNHDEHEEEFDEFNDSIEAKYGSVQDGFNMVFGKDASVGYVCGIESAVNGGTTSYNFIKSVAHGKYLRGHAGTSGAKVDTADGAGDWEKFFITEKPGYNGVYYIQNKQHKWYLAAGGSKASGETGNDVIGQPAKGTWEEWRIINAGSGKVAFQNVYRDTYLRSYSDGKVDQAPSNQDYEKWEIVQPTKNDSPKLNKFPGTCCLDAPYQNPGGEWGREFDCTMDCQTEAPFFSGLSEDSCEAVGGTWCAGPTNCERLQACVDEEISTANAAGKLAYVAYLEPGIVDDHLDFDSCGDSREYFGYDALYKNDDDICENIKQLHNTKDFDFLDEVYAQGTPLESGPQLDWKELDEVDTSSSQSNMVQDGPVKEGLIYGLGVYRDGIAAKVDAISEFKCPMGVTTGSTLCISIKNVFFIFLHAVLFALNLAYNAWEFAHEDTACTNNIQPIEDWEILQYQHRNNKIMHDGTKKAYETVATLQHSLLGSNGGGGKIGDILDCLEDPDTCQSRRALIGALDSNAQFAGCDGRDQDGDGIIDNCEEDNFPPKVAVVSALAIKNDGNTKLVADKVFPSTEDAVSSLRGALSVVDDCAAKEDLTLNLTVKETNKCGAVIAASPIHWCNNVANMGKTEEFSVAVDSKPPVISCGFQSSATPTTTTATGPANQQPQQQQQQKFLFVEEGEGFFDTGLSLQVADLCSAKLDVHVSVMSNEFDTNGPSAYLGLAEDGNDAKVVVPKLFLNQETCSGSQKTGFCQESPIGSRVYKVAVEATDAVGWSASDTCHIVVVTPKQNKKVSNGAQEERELLLNEKMSLEEQSQLVEQAGTQLKLEAISYVHHLSRE